MAPAIGYDFGLTSANGTNLNLALTNTSGSMLTASFILMGDYNNQWQVSITWGPSLVPIVTVTMFSGQNIAPTGLTVQPGVPVPLTNLTPDYGDTAVYQVIFNNSQASQGW